VLALLADENFKAQIQTGLRRRLPSVDLVSLLIEGGTPEDVELRVLHLPL
jgi:hypothetical protein